MSYCLFSMKYGTSHCASADLLLLYIIQRPWSLWFIFQNIIHIKLLLHCYRWVTYWRMCLKYSIVHLPEAGPVSKTAPASCPWEMHHWPAAATLEDREKGGDGVGSKSRSTIKHLSWILRLTRLLCNRQCVCIHSIYTYVCISVY